LSRLAGLADRSDLGSLAEQVVQFPGPNGRDQGIDYGRQLVLGRNHDAGLALLEFDGFHDQTVYLASNGLGNLGTAFPETDVDEADLEAVIGDLMSGQYSDPIGVAAFQYRRGLVI
jgi:hypothetical protein